MKDGQTLVSAGKIFELGFFSPSMSSRRYLGIWYIISKSAVVWVANRENPLTDHSRVLNISSQGILVLLNGTKEVVWSSNTSGTAQKPIAKLLQSENLVVKDENDDSEKFLWQSFDYPSDTLLPGMKLGKNLVTGLNKVISSWKDTDDPARGKFTQEIDLHGEGGLGCLLWFDSLIDMRKLSDGEQDLYIRMAATELDYIKRKRMKNQKIKTEIIVGSVMIAFSLLSLGLLLCVRRKEFRKLGLAKENLKNNYRQKGMKEEMELALFNLMTIARATNNFSRSNKLGEGGFGSVCKGTMIGGQDIAVKRLSKNSGQGLEEFKNEAKLISRLQHYNLRIHIIGGIARGLLYLHQDSRLRIVHRDLKASNILLDSEMNPKISDFGLARIFKRNQSEATTKRVIGTHGYMSPEYAVDGLFSVKSDVFSFGVLVLEIVSGKKNWRFRHPVHDLNLLGHAWILWGGGRTLELIDELLARSFPPSEAVRCIHVALLCTQQYPEDRPSMSSVVLMLGSEGTLPQPKQPGFYIERKQPAADTGSSKHKSCSANEVTITLLEAG
ncbi:receptor kinase 1 [Melia azedarach]|uniref:Receptor kinase 1 n=1 Tax=Melia azedarach TaxID=155640 RepID=A0ACC1YU92_MELAZ|nr:receptor kinase 1 [Melia azedarach]